MMPDLRLDQHVEQSQEQTQNQRLIVSQKHQQAIELLQYPAFELRGWLHEQMEQNPLLELSDLSQAEEPEDELVDELDEDDDELLDDIESDVEQLLEDRAGYEGFRASAGYNSDEPHPEDRFRAVARQHQTLQESLLWQLEVSEIEGEDQKLAKHLISYINKDGFMDGELPDIADDLDVATDRLEEILDFIQTMDPPGVGARNLKESIRVQLELQQDPIPESTLEVLDQHFEEIQNRQFKKLAREQDYDLEVLQRITDRIQGLEPRPGRRFEVADRQYISPDVVLRNLDDEQEILINESEVPPLRISPEYRAMLNSDDQEAQEYVRDKLKGALWILHCIYQRNRTLYEVTKSIVDHQEDFFEHGVQALQPLVLDDIAEDIDVHESTVSRAINDKYIQTDRGQYPLQFFFSSSLDTTGDGEQVSSTAVKARIREIIDQEDPTDPLSDGKIQDVLDDEEIDIGRRTISKYRKQMNILPWNLRRNAVSD